MKIETWRKGKRVGVTRDDEAVGYAVEAKPGSWTAFVYTSEPPFDFTRTGFKSATDAVAYIARYGQRA